MAVDHFWSELELIDVGCREFEMYVDFLSETDSLRREGWNELVRGDGSVLISSGSLADVQREAFVPAKRVIHRNRTKIRDINGDIRWRYRGSDQLTHLILKM